MKNWLESNFNLWFLCDKSCDKTGETCVCQNSENRLPHAEWSHGWFWGAAISHKHMWFLSEKFISIGILAPSLIRPSASDTFLCLVHFHGLRRKCLSSCFSMHYQKNMDTQKLSVSQGDSAFHWLQWSVYIFNTLLTHTASFSLSVKSGKNIVSVVAVAERTRHWMRMPCGMRKSQIRSISVHLWIQRVNNPEGCATKSKLDECVDDFQSYQKPTLESSREIVKCKRESGSVHKFGGVRRQNWTENTHLVSIVERKSITVSWIAERNMCTR